jgi:hypothetical protein
MRFAESPVSTVLLGKCRNDNFIQEMYLLPTLNLSHSAITYDCVGLA